MNEYVAWSIALALVFDVSEEEKERNSRTERSVENVENVSGVRDNLVMTKFRSAGTRVSISVFYACCDHSGRSME